MDHSQIHARAQHINTRLSRAPQARLGDAGAQRRCRYIKRLCGAPDSEARWGAFLARIERQFDIDRDVVDRALDDALEADPRALALLGAAR
jgi:hypothetical protein